jgi:SAM-dependent methyltransferase
MRNPDMVSRYLRTDDARVVSVAGVNLRSEWWSRPYEYAWAAGFTGTGLLVLDAGCGVTHPFKWHLAETCASVVAVDSDGAVQGGISFVAANRAEWGEQLENLRCNWEHARLRQGDITRLDCPDASFDRIFCISVLEHMDPLNRVAAVREFARVLAPGGMVLLTMDVPACNPADVLAQAAQAGLTPAGEVDLDQPANLLRSEPWYRGLSVFRAALVEA